jgi:hypothetical protein
MGNFKTRCDELEKDVITELKSIINTSEEVSDFINSPAIKDVFHRMTNGVIFVEMVVVNGELVFLDSNGYHYPHGYVSLTDLVELVDFLNELQK